MQSSLAEKFLDLNQFANSKVYGEPFRYAVIDDLLTETQASQLSSDFPDGGFYRSSRNFGSDKTYQVDNNILLVLSGENQECKESLPNVWRDFLTFLEGREYRLALSEMLEIDLSKCHLEITLKKYKKNDYISAHTDRSWVDATHLFFLNNHWESEWGGYLQLLTAEKEAFLSLAPVFNRSVAFVRSDESWHEVTPVLHPTEQRLALQVALWNTTDRFILPGRVTEVSGSFNGGVSE